METLEIAYCVIFDDYGRVIRWRECDPAWATDDEPIWTWLKGELCVCVLADDPAAAVKIAGEERYKYLLSG